MRRAERRTWVTLIARPAAIGVLCLVYSIVLAEVFVRAIVPQAFVPRDVSAAAFGVRMNTPNAVYLQRTPEMRARIEINSQGLRSPRDFALAKPPGVARIAVFGDSYFLGYEGAYEDIASTRLERALRDAHCAVEVLNFAVSGFGTAEMLRTLEAYGLEFEPDIVIFQWHHTDPDDNRRSNLYRLADDKLMPTGETYVPAVKARKHLEGNALYQFVASESHLFTALREKASRFTRRAMAGRVFSRHTTGADPGQQSASALDLALLDRAESVARAAGAAFFVVDVPAFSGRTRFRSGFDLLPADYRARANYLSPIERFRQQASRSTKLFWERGHKHLTPEGNRLVAETITASLASSGAMRTHLGCNVDDEARDRMAAQSEALLEAPPRSSR